MPWCSLLYNRPHQMHNQVPSYSFKSLFLRVNFLKRLSMIEKSKRQYLIKAGFLLLFFCMAISLNLSAQDDDVAPRRGSKIIDDTTKEVYGPRTSQFFFEEDVFLNKFKLHYIDTVIRGFHRYNYVQRNENLMQDLGNIGTAIQPIFYEAPAQIGVTSGISVYDLYWDARRIRYYDTKSTYSNMRVILGGKGRSITEAAYSRNINPRWNFGFNYRGLFIDKQIQRSGKGDRNVKGTYYDLYTTYYSKDSTYRLFFNFQRSKHAVEEYGGVRDPESLNYEEFFFENAQPSLTEAFQKEVRINVHLFHQYEIGKALQVYHKFDRYRQGNRFEDVPASEPDGYYDYTEVDSTQTYDWVKFKTVRNEVGIKGNLLKLFYNGYYAIRNYSMSYAYVDVASAQVKTDGVESYLGGRIALRLDSIGELSAWGEVMETGNYRLEGQLASRWFTATVKQMQYAPSFMQQLYRGSHDNWNNNFSPVNVSQLGGHIMYNGRVLQVYPGVMFTRIGNYVLFKDDPNREGQRVLPEQTSGDIVMAAPELKLGITMARHIHLRGRAIYTQLITNTNSSIQVPVLFVNGELSYENIFFNGNLDMHGGVDVHWKSDYNAMGYDVPTQQFYVQQTYSTPAFPIVDVFFGARIKRARILFKYNNLVQLFTKQGYMPTPYYPGQRNIIDFGFEWSFYD